MNDLSSGESAMWDARCNDLQNSLDRVREERDDLRIENKLLSSENSSLKKQVAIFEQMVGRMQVLMAQGVEL